MCLPYSLWISGSLKLAADVEWNCTVSSPFHFSLSFPWTLGNHLLGTVYQDAISMSDTAHRMISNICFYAWPSHLTVTNLRMLKAGGGLWKGKEVKTLLIFFFFFLNTFYAFDRMCLLDGLCISSQVWYGQNGSNCQRWLSEKWHSVSQRVSSSPVWNLSLHCKNPLRQKQGYSMKCFCD